MTLSAKDRIDIFGTEDPPAAEQTLSAGKLSLRIADGQIASVAWGETEILRGVTYFLRDADWATPPGITSTAVKAQTPDRFEAEIHGEIDAGGIRFAYTMIVAGDRKGRLKIATRGTALSSFRSNRAGLTVLHPLDCAGSALVVTHSDGGTETTVFPVLISPSQPVFDIAGLSYELGGGETVAIGFKSTTPNGGAQVFEMEDQRNWGDASYKTYVGSLLDPWPFDVEEGGVFVQEVTVAIAESTGAVAAPGAVSGLGTGGFALPEVGVSIPLDGATEALRNVQSHDMFRPSFVSAYLRSNALSDTELGAVRAISETLDCPLRIELEVDGDPAEALPLAARAIRAANIAVEAILACPEPYLHSYQPNAEWPDVMPLADFYALVRAAFPEARIGGGMLTYFTELNRKWPPADAIDFVGHSYCPIVHAADDRTVVQNIDTLAYIANTVAKGLPGVPYELVSARLSMRQNPYGAAPQANPDNKRIAMAGADPREKGQFAGLWMLEVAEVMARTHVERICLGALSGDASIFSAEQADGHLPSYYALDALCGLADADEAAFRSVKDELVGDRFALADAVFKELRG